VDSTVSTQVTAYAVTATAIQIRFRAAESTVVPVPTDSFKLPRGYLLTREKVGIGVGVPVAVGLLTMVVWYCCCARKRQRKESVERVERVERVVTVTDRGLDFGFPPPYPGLDMGLPPPYSEVDGGRPTEEARIGRHA
jgi:hypothetical protein